MHPSVSRARYGLSASTLKIMACLVMLIDHIGLKFFPNDDIFRIIGRLAFPLFAFFIAEGCRYTRNKLKRFLLVFVLGILCETVYILYTGRMQGNILLTFSLSILLVYCLQFLKHSLFTRAPFRIVLSSLLLLACLLLAHPIAKLLDLDYGYTGVLLPLFVTLFDYKAGEDPEYFAEFDRLAYRLCAFFVGLLLLVLDKGFDSLQVWCLLAVIPLAFYNGKAGSRKLKYGFYLFYPLHLLAIEAVSVLLG